MHIAGLFLLYYFWHLACVAIHCNMERNKTDTMSIKAWAEGDRPREKLISHGRLSLSDAELIAILIGSGSKQETAVDLSRRILQDASNNLKQLSKYSIQDFVKFKGIGHAKAISILAALELGRRRKESEELNQDLISSSKDAYEIIKPFLLDITHEEFWILCLSRANKVIKTLKISQGGITATVVDTRLVFLKALEHSCCSIILCHNHPSGNKKPSEEDIVLTSKIKEAGKIMDIPVLDHLIFCDNGYFSFADEGML